MSSTNRGGERQELDHYQTPRWCVDMLMNARRADGSYHMPSRERSAVMIRPLLLPALDVALACKAGDPGEASGHYRDGQASAYRAVAALLKGAT